MGSNDVLFLHGQPGVGTDWDAVAEQLPPELTAITPDRPGYGASHHPAGGFDHNARYALADLDAAGIADVTVVGHSYGGGVALAMAALAPERVRGLVLIASVGPHCLDGWDRLLAAPGAGEIGALSAWWLTPWLARARVAHLERGLHRSLEPHEHLYWEIWANSRYDHGALWRTFLVEQRELVRHLDGLDGRIDQIRAPAIVLADPADKMVPVRTAYALLDRLPEASLQLVPGGAHHLPRRAPGVVADAVTKFVGMLP